MNLITEIAIPFLLGILGFIKIDVVGALALNEILLLVISPFYLNRALRVLQLPAFRSTFLLGLAYLFSLIAADLYRDTPSQDHLRGWAKLGVTLFSFILLVPILFDNKRALPAFIIGWFLSPFASIIAYGVQWNLYKFYIGGPISTATFLVVGYAHRYLRKATHFMPFLAAGMAFLQNCRSLAGITIIAQIANLLAIRQKSRCDSYEHYTASGKARSIFIFLFFCLLVLGTIEIYKYTVVRGFWGEESQTKYEMESLREGFFLLTVRSDHYYTWPKIFESPIIGYGSWAKDIDYVISRANELGINPAAVVDPLARAGEYGLIQTHSHVTAGWLEAGIFGGIFWIIALWRTIKLLVSGGMASIGRLAPLMTFFLVGFAWDVLFSPYGGSNRLWSGFMLALIAWTETQIRDADIDDPGQRIEKNR